MMPSQTHQKIVEQLLEKSRKKELHFALAIIYPDENEDLWFEAHTSGDRQILKTLFKMDTNAEAEVKLYLNDNTNSSEQTIHFSLPPQKIKVEK